MGVGIRHNRLVVVLPDLCGVQLDNKYKPKKALLSDLSRLGLKITNVSLKNFRLGYKIEWV